MCDLKKVFLSPRTCSNATPQLVDRLLLLCYILYALGQPQTKVYIYEDHIKAALSDNIASQAYKESSVFGMLCMIHYNFIG